MAPDWKNPMPRVKATEVVLDPLELISMEDARALTNTYQLCECVAIIIQQSEYNQSANRNQPFFCLKSNPFEKIMIDVIIFSR